MNRSKRIILGKARAIAKSLKTIDFNKVADRESAIRQSLINSSIEARDNKSSNIQEKLHKLLSSTYTRNTN